MPCWMRSEVSLRLSNPNLDLLLEAAKAFRLWATTVKDAENLGKQYGHLFAVDGQHDFGSGKMPLSIVVKKDGSVAMVGPNAFSASQVNAFNREYSKAVVGYAAKQRGWTLTAKSENQFEARRRV